MELKFLSKQCDEFSTSYGGRYQKPATCPHCGFGTDAPITNKASYNFNSKNLLIATCKCTSCGKSFFFACEREINGDGKFVCMYPNISFVPYQNEILNSISTRFIDIYNQALRSEFIKISIWLLLDSDPHLKFL